MDVPGSGRADLLATPAQAAGEQARLRALAREPKGHDREDLARVAREFEGVFLDILMRSMRSTVPESGLTGAGGATQIYRQMHDSELARTLAGTGDGLGVARMLEAQFAEQFAEDEETGDLAGPATAPAVPLALARYRATMPPRPDATPRVQDLGELPNTPLLAPAGWPALPAPAVAAVAPVPGPVQASQQATPTAAPAGGQDPEPEAAQARDADANRPRRPNLVPTDRRLAAAPLQAAEADTVRRFGTQIETAAAASGLDPRLVLAVVMEESGGDPAARSRAGARGLMQLMPGTARDLGVRDAGDPAANLRGGSRYLADQLDRFGGRLDLALAAYNAGPGNVDRAGGRIPAFPETRNYVARVMDRYARLRTGTELDRASP